MGLAERRAIKGFQDNHLPALSAEIHRLAGFEVPIEINWEQLAKEDYADSYAEHFRKVYFDPTIGALQAVAIDDLGKDALKAGLKKICFANTKDTSTASYAVSFSDGVLTIDHSPCTNVDDIGDRTTELTKALEKGL